MSKRSKVGGIMRLRYELDAVRGHTVDGSGGLLVLIHRLLDLI